MHWEGYEQTVKTLRHALWQVTGIGRTLVDAADERQPAPSPDFLSRYADTLGSIAEAVQQFGLHDEDATQAFDRSVEHALEVLTELREEVRVTPLDDPEQWPVYRSLISDAKRAMHELELGPDEASPADRHRALRVTPKSGVSATRGHWATASDPAEGGAPSRGERQRRSTSRRLTSSTTTALR